MPMIELKKSKPVGPPVLMTHPSGNPAMVPELRVGDYLARGYKKGYKEPKEVTERRAANKVDPVLRNRELNAEIVELKKKLEELQPKETRKKSLGD